MLTVERTPDAQAGEARALACPPNIAQWLHDEVVQRLCSVVAVLGSDGRLHGADQARCRVELEAAVGALRTLLNDQVEQQRSRRFHTVVEAVRASCAAPDGRAVRLRIMGDAEVCSATGQFIADFVAEAIRNVIKHAHAQLTVLTVTVARDAVRIDVFNDGVPSAPDSVGAGVGLRLLAASALEHGGSVATGPACADGWSTTLTLTRQSNDGARAFGSSACLCR